MRNVFVLGLVALGLVMFAAPKAHADVVTIHDTLGDNPVWVDGGQPMSVRYNMAPGGGWIASGIRFTIAEPTIIHTINGVMANSGSSAWTSPLHINVHSSEAQFGASALLGDVYHDNQAFIANLSGGSPPAWGGTDSSGKVNHLVELGFEPFVLEPGDYVISVQAYLTGALLSWTETLNPLGIPSDIATTSEMFPDWVERSSLSVYTTGNAAVLIQGTVVPTPGPALCLAFAAAGVGSRRKRGVCTSTTKQIASSQCISKERC